MKNQIKLIMCILLISVIQLSAQLSDLTYLKGYSILPPFDEQVRTFIFNSDVRIQINAPSPETFDKTKPVGIALFATPNGNTIEQTFGKRLKTGDDWHYDIQHIGAQTRFLRDKIKEYNLVTVYLETAQKSWPSWRAAHSDNAELIGKLVDSVKSYFSSFNTFIVLTGHSGGGSMTFGYLNNVSEIPGFVKRISFLDSNYGYDDTQGPKFLNWLNASEDHHLSVIAYNDSVALLNGQPVVSPTGGTWYRSRLMQNYLKQHMQFTTEENDEFIKYTALNGRVKFILKKNPEQKIYHTVQVELNGFIQGMVSGTPYEGSGYTYYGERAYTKFIQGNILQFKDLNIPKRPVDAKIGSEFMQYIMNMTFEEREAEILKEISKGNIPDFLRNLRTVRTDLKDDNGKSYKCYYQVMPDYLAIGSDKDYCRIPMGPKTAQTIANLFGAIMPTPKFVDNIYMYSDLKVAPVTYTPVGNQNELVAKFIEHSSAIDNQINASIFYLPGVYLGGIKKDVVISNKIIDPARTHHVVIYGWHKLDGTPIQPVYNGHIDTYVDYSHGVRLLNKEIILDTILTTIPDVLRDPVLYKIISNEAGPMYQPGYFKEVFLPAQPRSFGVIPESSTSLKLMVKADTSVTSYKVKIGKDGKIFGKTVFLQPDNLIIPGLQKDSLFFIKLIAVNSKGESPESEVLACVPSDENPSMIIVNGFDRSSAGNTYNFIKQHASAFHKSGTINICSAANEAITDGLLNLTDYSSVDYILGEESTADETFNSAEQSKIKEFLSGGGNLFVSGSEIAWDLDYKGTAADKTFFNNYLKAAYIADAPNSQSGTYYKAESIHSSIFANNTPFFFDNGTQGTINVKWPDVIKPLNGGNGLLKYSGVDTSTGYAGIYYNGLFGTRNNSGKLIVIGFPFETIYPESKRIELAKEISDFFEVSTVVAEDEMLLVNSYYLSQNYPNPFNPTTNIRYNIPQTEYVTLKIYDILGKEVITLVDGEQAQGVHEIEFNASSLTVGVYIYQLTSGTFSQSKKLILLK